MCMFGASGGGGGSGQGSGPKYAGNEDPGANRNNRGERTDASDKPGESPPKHPEDPDIQGREGGY